MLAWIVKEDAVSTTPRRSGPAVAKFGRRGSWSSEKRGSGVLDRYSTWDCEREAPTFFWKRPPTNFWKRPYTYIEWPAWKVGCRFLPLYAASHGLGLPNRRGHLGVDSGDERFHDDSVGTYQLHGQVFHPRTLNKQ